MAYLTYIADVDLENEVKTVLRIAVTAKQMADKNFGKNVIDPFSALFETAGFSVSHQTWVESEKTRQSQKTLQNHVGNFHQKILGHVKNWEDLGVGGEVDLRCDSRRIIAEIKNKYSTVTGGKLQDVYKDLERLVMQKTNYYKGYTAYFVTIIPKTPTRFDKPFTPSDKSVGDKCAENPLIRIIDGASFYALVTGREHALSELFSVLPKVITKVLKQEYSQDAWSPEDLACVTRYFGEAFGSA